MSSGPGSKRRLVDFGRLVDRLRTAAITLGVLALAGAVGEGLLEGLTFAVLVRWSSALVAAFSVVAAVLVAVHALGGADRAQRRGERLSGDDVGLVPRRRDRR